MSAVAGIDIDTRHIHIVLIDDDTRHASYIPVDIHDRRSTFEAARNVKTALAVAGVGSAVWDQVWLVGIEKPFSSSRATVYSYGLVGGALLACIPRGMEVFHLNPQVWRQELGLPAKASKRDVAMWSNSEAGIFGGNDTFDWPQDAFDAYAIGRAAASVKERAEAA